MKTCKVEGCNDESKSRGYCIRHYYKARRAGEFGGNICKVEGCNKITHGKGYCNNHYAIARRAGEFGGNICKVEGCKNFVQGRGYCNKHLLQIQRHGKILNRTIYDLNEYRIENNAAYMSLYNKRGDKIKKEAIIDIQDVERCQEYKWCVTPKGYVKTDIKKENGERGSLLLHNFVLDRNVDLHILPDHVNRNKLDNRKSNLRITTRRRNNLNSKLRKDNIYGLRGVSKDKRLKSKPWVASSCGKVLGYFATKEEAHQAYVNYIKKFHLGFLGETRGDVS